MIVGAGYAGVMAANRLRSSLTREEAARDRVVLINRTDQFVERIRLHQVAAGTMASAARPLREMLHNDVDLVVGEAVRIDPDRNLVVVATETGPRVERFDTLIYAIGSVAATEVPGAATFGYPIPNPDAAHAAREVIAKIRPGQTVLVVGGGATAVETAAEIAEHHPDAQVTLLCGDDLVGFMPAQARTRISRTLARLEVQIHELARVARVLEDGVELEDGTPLPSDVTVWAASFGVPQLAAASGLAVDEIGRLRVGEYLRSVDYPDIIGAGDAARPPASIGAHLRMSCAMALPLGGHAANTALAHLRATEPQHCQPVTSFSASASAGAKGTCSSYTPTTHPARSTSPAAPPRRSRRRSANSSSPHHGKERTKPGSYRAPAGPRRQETTTVTV